MIKIANKGNHSGENPERENTILYLEEAMALGYDVKIDVWLIDKVWMLGERFPDAEQTIPRDFMENPQVWVSAKNLVGYVSLYRNSKVQVFWHNRDDFTFTSMGIKWANYGVMTRDGVLYLPELDGYIHEKLVAKQINPLGVCSNNLQLY